MECCFLLGNKFPVYQLCFLLGNLPEKGIRIAKEIFNQSGI